MTAKTDYITKLSNRIIDLVNDLETLENGDEVAGLFDGFGSPPITAESTKSEILRTISLIAAAL